jgi:hypothetical protein
MIVVYAIPTEGAPSLRFLQGWAAMLHALLDWLRRDMDQQLTTCAWGGAVIPQQVVPVVGGPGAPFLAFFARSGAFRGYPLAFGSVPRRCPFSTALHTPSVTSDLAPTS